MFHLFTLIITLHVFLVACLYCCFTCLPQLLLYMCTLLHVYIVVSPVYPNYYFTCVLCCMSIFCFTCLPQLLLYMCTLLHVYIVVSPVYPNYYFTCVLSCMFILLFHLFTPIITLHVYFVACLYCCFTCLPQLLLYMCT